MPQHAFTPEEGRSPTQQNTFSTEDTMITYDHRTKSFTVVLPTGGQFQVAGNRQEAEAAYLFAVAPSLAERVSRLAARYPELASRAHRAAFLIVEGRVNIFAEPKQCCTRSGTGTWYAEVKSQCGDEAYLISTSTRDWDRKLQCNCPDDTAPASNVAEHTCMHIIAYVLAD